VNPFHVLAVLDDPLTRPVLEEIDAARSGGVLRDIERSVIPHCVGISDGERAALFERVRERFARLNAATPQVFPNGRWTK